MSSEFAKTDLHAWREGFFNRLEAHARRAAATAVAAEGAIGEKTEATEETESTGCVSCGYPKIVTFAGKRQVRLRTAVASVLRKPDDARFFYAHFPTRFRGYLDVSQWNHCNSLTRKPFVICYDYPHHHCPSLCLAHLFRIS